MIIGNATTKDAALAIALPLARELGYVYLCQWPSLHWTVEDRKPLVRGLAVIEVRDGGEQFCA